MQFFLTIRPNTIPNMKTGILAINNILISSRFESVIMYNIVINIVTMKKLNITIRLVRKPFFKSFILLLLTAENTNGKVCITI